MSLKEVAFIYVRLVKRNKCLLDYINTLAATKNSSSQFCIVEKLQKI